MLKVTFELEGGSIKDLAFDMTTSEDWVPKMLAHAIKAGLSVRVKDIEKYTVTSLKIKEVTRKED